MNKRFNFLSAVFIISIVLLSSCSKEKNNSQQASIAIAGSYRATGLERKSTPRVVNDSLVIDSLGPTKFRARFPTFLHRDFEFDVINDSCMNFRLLNPHPLTFPPYADGFVNGECMPLTPPWTHSIYKNRYDRPTKTFYLHYTYILGPASPPYCYSDVNFEKWVKL
jgi:hypothetical protein